MHHMTTNEALQIAMENLEILAYDTQNIEEYDQLTEAVHKLRNLLWSLPDERASD